MAVQRAHHRMSTDSPTFGASTSTVTPECWNLTGRHLLSSLDTRASSLPTLRWSIGIWANQSMLIAISVWPRLGNLREFGQCRTLGTDSVGSIPGYEILPCSSMPRLHAAKR
jgi:hypothetical protein